MRKCAKISSSIYEEDVSHSMTLQLPHYEFPYIWGKFDFLFYQCISDLVSSIIVASTTSLEKSVRSGSWEGRFFYIKEWRQKERKNICRSWLMWRLLPRVQWFLAFSRKCSTLITLLHTELNSRTLLYKTLLVFSSSSGHALLKSLQKMLK